MPKINWGVRARNPLFWAQCVSVVVLTLVAGTGLTWEDMTTWQALADALVRALGNPVVVVAAAAALWGVVTDPTTAGASDSAAALGYENPKESEG